MFNEKKCGDHCLERIAGALKKKEIHVAWDEDTSFDEVVHTINSCFEKGSAEHRELFQIAFMRDDLKRRDLEYSEDNLRRLIEDSEYQKRFHEEYDRRYGES